MNLFRNCYSLYFHIFLILLFIYSCPGYAQENACIPIIDRECVSQPACEVIYCRIYNPDFGGWITIMCAEDFRCANISHNDITGYREEVCVPDESDNNYCYIVDGVTSRRVLCSSESICPIVTEKTESDSPWPAPDKKKDDKDDDIVEEQINVAVFAVVFHFIEKIVRDIQLSNRAKTVFKDSKYIQEIAEEDFLNLLIENFFTAENFNEDWLQNIDKFSKDIKSYVKSLILKEMEPLKPEDLELASKRIEKKLNELVDDIKDTLAIHINNFRNNMLRDEQLKQLESFFAAIDIQENPNWVEEANTIIREVEEKIKHPIYSDPVVLDQKIIAPDLETSTLQIENNLYDEAMRYAKHHALKPLEKSIGTGIGAVDQVTRESTKQAESVDIQPLYRSLPSPQDHYQKDVEDIAKEALKNKFDRRRMGFLQDEDLNQPKEKPYEFQSPDGEFLEESKDLYSELYEANSFHEQGVYAREIGIAAVQVADEEFARGNTEEAGLAYQIGEGVSDITLGIMPYVGVGKDTYEALIGRHLLTGRELTGFERSLSVVGIALSMFSAGVLSSGHIQLALKSTENVLSKISRKLGDKVGSALKHLQLVEYPQAFFRKVGEVRVKTKEGAQSILKDLKKVFVRKNPSIKEMEGAIESSAKRGVGKGSGDAPKISGKRAPPPRGSSSAEKVIRAVESAGGNTKAYKAALQELPDLPDSGKEFLANRVFYAFRESGEQISQTQLARLGRLYTQYEKVISIERLGSVRVKEKVWRLLIKEGVDDSSGQVFKNSPEGIFKDHPGIIGSNRRFSASGDWGMYSSINRKTAIKETREYYFRRTNIELTDDQVMELHHIGSKEIELNKVLDLTNDKTLRDISENASLLTTENITKQLSKRTPDSYELTQMVGHIAKRKGYKGIKALSAADEGRVNIIIFNRDLL